MGVGSACDGQGEEESMEVWVGERSAVIGAATLHVSARGCGGFST